MSNYQSLRKAGFSEKKLRKMGITKEFPENPKFKQEHFQLAREMPNLELMYFGNDSASAVLDVLGCVVGCYDIPLDAPLTIYNANAGVKYGLPNFSNFVSDSQVPYILDSLPSQSAFREFYELGRNYIGSVASYHPGDTLQDLTHELAHFVDSAKGRLKFVADGLVSFNGIEYKLIRKSSIYGEYENQPHEKSANINGMKIAKAFCKLVGRTELMPNSHTERSFEFYLDPPNYPKELRHLFTPATTA